MILEYHMLREHVSPPYRANPSDAGLDICYSPDSHSRTAANYIVIESGECAIIPTGLKFGIPHGYMLEVKNRSSVAAKRSLIVGACVIDSGYDGEVFINLHNIGKHLQVITPGDKIAQLVMIPVVAFRPIENTDGVLYDYPMTISDRGDGALGSTDEA